MQAAWIILSPLFILVKTGTYVIKAVENKSALHGGSQ